MCDIYPFKDINCNKNSILKLKKSLYNLKQLIKCWNNEANDFFLEISFCRSDNDYCLYR